MQGSVEFSVLGNSTLDMGIPPMPLGALESERVTTEFSLGRAQLKRLMAGNPERQVFGLHQH
jgi:hypothetical protein